MNNRDELNKLDESLSPQPTQPKKCQVPKCPYRHDKPPQPEVLPEESMKPTLRAESGKCKHEFCSQKIIIKQERAGDFYKDGQATVFHRTIRTGEYYCDECGELVYIITD